MPACRDTVTLLSQAHTQALRHLAKGLAEPGAKLIELAMQAIASLGTGSTAAVGAVADALSCGEAPLAQVPFSLLYLQSACCATWLQYVWFAFAAVRAERSLPPEVLYACMSGGIACAHKTPETTHLPDTTFSHALHSSVSHMPLQASVLYVVQAAVIPALEDTSLASLLDQLRERCIAIAANTTTAATLPRQSVPEATALLATIGHALNAPTAPPQDAERSLRDAAHRLLMCGAQPVSCAAALVLGQLAAAHGSSAAELMLDYLSLVQLHLAEVSSQTAASYRASTNGAPFCSASCHVRVGSLCALNTSCNARASLWRFALCAKASSHTYAEGMLQAARRPTAGSTRCRNWKAPLSRSAPCCAP